MSDLRIGVLQEPNWLPATLNPWGWVISEPHGSGRLVVAAGPAQTEAQAWADAEARLPQVQAERTAKRRAGYTGLARWAFQP